MVRQLKEEIISIIREREFIAAVNIGLILFLAYYFLFYALYKPIHEFYPAVDLKNIIYWVPTFRDGIETQVMLFGSFLYIFASIWLEKRLVRFNLLGRKSLTVVFILPLIYILLNLHAPIFQVAPYWQTIGLLASLGVVILLGGFFIKTWFKLLAWFIFTAIIIAAIDTPWTDYGYYLGPALKLMQGKNLGSFYLQYGLGGSLLFEAMMFIKINLHQIEIVLGLIFASWFLLYYFLSNYFIEDTKLRFQFLLACMIIRYLSINHDPLAAPQVLSLRLELWVPALLIVTRFGLNSWVTASVFSLIYVFDNSFGFLYLITYLVFSLSLSYITSDRFLNFLKKASVLIIPITPSVLFNLYFFSSLTAPAGKLYLLMGIGMMPIASTSIFWCLFACLPISAFIFIKSYRKDNSEKAYLRLFLFGIALMQLTYFYGRSHEHNLLNISGILILLFFVTADSFAELYHQKLLPSLVCALLIFSSTIAFGGHILKKIDRATNNVLTGHVFEQSDYEKLITDQKTILNMYPKGTPILVLSDSDSLVNYHWGLKQIGYMTPFHSNIYVDKTAYFLIDEIKHGTKVILWEPEEIDLICQLNRSESMQTSNLHFEMEDKQNFKELKLAPAYHFKTFVSSNLSFKYPDFWRVQNSKGKVNLLSDNLSIEILQTQKNAGFSMENYIKSVPVASGVLISEGTIQIQGIESAYLRVWKDADTQRLQFFLLKGNNIVMLSVFPFNASLKCQLNQIFDSLKF